MADPSVLEVQVSGQIVVSVEDVNGDEVHHHENGDASIEEEEAPVPEVINEIPEDSPEKPKKSYASIVSSLLKHLELLIFQTHAELL